MPEVVIQLAVPESGPSQTGSNSGGPAVPREAALEGHRAAAGTVCDSVAAAHSSSRLFVCN